jgi:hypothetical protein
MYFAGIDRETASATRGDAIYCQPGSSVSGPLKQALLEDGAENKCNLLKYLRV